MNALLADVVLAVQFGFVLCVIGGRATIWIVAALGARRVFATVLLMWRLRLEYWLGADPGRLVVRYDAK